MVRVRVRARVRVRVRVRVSVRVRVRVRVWGLRLGLTYSRPSGQKWIGGSRTQSCSICV